MKPDTILLLKRMARHIRFYVTKNGVSILPAGDVQLVYRQLRDRGESPDITAPVRACLDLPADRMARMKLSDLDCLLRAIDDLPGENLPAPSVPHSPQAVVDFTLTDEQAEQPSKPKQKQQSKRNPVDSIG